MGRAFSAAAAPIRVRQGANSEPPSAERRTSSNSYRSLMRVQEGELNPVSISQEKTYP